MIQRKVTSMAIRPASILDRLRPRAQKIYNDRDKMEELLRDSEGKSRKLGIRQMYADIKVLISLLSDYKKGSYRDINKGSVLFIIAGLVYLVSPIDLVPDFIFGLGFLDDAMILGYILKQLYEVLDRYKIWKYTKETVPIETTNKE
jgi:uncharacterized membrane protein YkvA (DUF1232 family)